VRLFPGVGRLAVVLVVEEEEERLDGGNAGGAVRVGDTVRRAAGPWTPAVHALLSHLASKGFAGCPRPLGIDWQGREILTFVQGQTVGSALPWPGWAYAEDTLVQVARWLRCYHTVVADFVPPEEAVWRLGGQWRRGLVIGHNDASPYNAVWRAGRLAGFIDWDMAGPVCREWDVAFAAFGWVPMHARHVAAREGFTDFGSRPRRLRRFLAEYGWAGTVDGFLDVVRARVSAHTAGVRSLAAAGDAIFARLAGQGIADDQDTALAELDQINPKARSVASGNDPAA
jgi:Phosphotransferase enzyme family